MMALIALFLHLILVRVREAKHGVPVAFPGAAALLTGLPGRLPRCALCSF